MLGQAWSTSDTQSSKLWSAQPSPNLLWPLVALNMLTRDLHASCCLHGLPSIATHHQSLLSGEWNQPGLSLCICITDTHPHSKQGNFNNIPLFQGVHTEPSRTVSYGEKRVSSGPLSRLLGHPFQVCLVCNGPDSLLLSWLRGFSGLESVWQWKSGISQYIHPHWGMCNWCISVRKSCSALSRSFLSAWEEQSI